jgi:hypothetical protein
MVSLISVISMMLHHFFSSGVRVVKGEERGEEFSVYG